MTKLFAVLATTLTLFSLSAEAADLDSVLAARSDTLKARDQYRHPKETLEFFEIKPGMTVADTLPGDWYGSILAPYLGSDGTYVGAMYSVEHYKKMWGERFTGARKERLTNFEDRWPGMVAGWAAAAPTTASFRIWEASEDLYGTLDAYLMVRAAHHLNKYDAAQLDAAAAEAFKLLKTDGIMGVVQHRAREDRDEEWAKGFNGYLKQSRVIEAFTNAGFVLEAASEINANPKDEANTGDRVWRLKPTGGKTPELAAIGESDRMTLKFRKPAE